MLDEQLVELIESSDKSFQIKDGILYKITIKPRNLKANIVCKVIPAQLVKETILFFHNSTFACHAGANKTKKQLLQAGFWFQDMDSKISNFTRSCQIYQEIKGYRSQHTQLSITASDLSFKKVAIDHFGPLPKSAYGNIHVLVVIDMFSRYVEIFPVTSLLPMELARTFYNNFILSHGFPEQVSLDNARTFFIEFNKQLAELCDIELNFTPHHHQASNGMVEKFMATLQTMILGYVNQETIVSRWDEQLRLLRFVYNNTYHASLQTSPFELVHGRLAKTPLIGKPDV